MSNSKYLIKSLITNQEFVVSSFALGSYKSNSIEEATAAAAKDVSEYVVAKILDHNIIDDQYEFLVEFTSGVKNWEPLSSLKNTRTNEELLKYCKSKKIKIPPCTRKKKG
ncbi:hypothetical protein GEMRC1_008537 [Eukaryota sp. GEM-RC1]